MSSYDETASPDRDPLSPAPEEAPDTVQETAPEAAGIGRYRQRGTGRTRSGYICPTGIPEEEALFSL